MEHDRLQQELIEKAFRHWETSQRVGSVHRSDELVTPRPFTITLSRQAGIPGSTVAREIGKRLGWIVYDHELLEKIAHDTGLRTNLLETVDERRVGWLRECVREFMQAIANVSFVSEDAYVHHLIETLLALGTHGECVIVGRGAAHVLSKETTLRVCLVAPVQDRVKALSQRLGISQQKAASQVRKIDSERGNFIRNHFQKDPRDPQNYDQVLNVSCFSTVECAQVVIEALRHLQNRTTDKSPNPSEHRSRDSSDLSR